MFLMFLVHTTEAWPQSFLQSKDWFLRQHGSVSDLVVSISDIHWISVRSPRMRSMSATAAFGHPTPFAHVTFSLCRNQDRSPPAFPHTNSYHPSRRYLFLLLHGVWQDQHGGSTGFQSFRLRGEKCKLCLRSLDHPRFSLALVAAASTRSVPAAS